MVWAWWEIRKVLFKPWKKARRSKPNPETYCWRKRNNRSQRNIRKHQSIPWTLFKRSFSKTNVEKQRFLNSLSTKTLTNEQYDLCENKISETDLFDFMKSIKNNKTPGNNGLTKEFYKTFWDELKTPLIESVNQVSHTKILSISQRQTVIKLIEKKDQDKHYIKNWRPISLLNVDTKVLSKDISNKLKTALPTLISSQQTVYVKNWFIGESGRMISHIIENSGCFNITDYLVTMDIEKAFDSLDHNFLISLLKKFCFGKTLLPG